MESKLESLSDSFSSEAACSSAEVCEEFKSGLERFESFTSKASKSEGPSCKITLLLLFGSLILSALLLLLESELEFVLGSSSSEKAGLSKEGFERSESSTSGASGPEGSSREISLLL